MPYEYGYELESCPDCGSSLYASGEKCANCGGEPKLQTPAELARLADVARGFAVRRKAQLEEQRKQEEANSTYVPLGRRFDHARKQVEGDLQKRVALMSESERNRALKEWKQAFKGQMQDAYRQARAEALSVITDLIALAQLTYNDERKVVLDTLVKNNRAKLQALLPPSQDVVGGKVNKARVSKGTSRTRRGRQLQKPPLVSAPRQPAQRMREARSKLEVPRIPTALKLVSEGTRAEVERAVQQARAYGLTPQYRVFSTKDPSVRWRAELSYTADDPELLKNLGEVGWGGLQN